MSEPPHTLWFTHDDGSWLEVVLEDVLQLYRPGDWDEHPGGLYIGSDPACDVMLDGDDVEGFHVLCYERIARDFGHYRGFEAIADRVINVGAPDALRAGNSTLGEVSIGGWRPARAADVEQRHGDAKIQAILAIAQDARLEGRTALAAMILAEARQRRVEVAPRTELPAPLMQASRVLRIRVEDSTGQTAIHTLGSIERLKHGITIGGDPDCDLALPAAGRNRIALVREGKLHLEVQAGAIVVHRRGPGLLGAGFRCHLDIPWSWIQLGDASVQLCRWPGRHEPLR